LKDDDCDGEAAEEERPSEEFRRHGEEISPRRQGAEAGEGVLRKALRGGIEEGVGGSKRV